MIPAGIPARRSDETRSVNGVVSARNAKQPVAANARTVAPSANRQPSGEKPKEKPSPKLNETAKNRGQSLAQMAVAWTLRDPRVTSCLIGARTPQQVIECVAALDNPVFDQAELDAIDAVAPR